MKKVIIIIAALILNAGAFAQAPNKMSYQTVIRNAAGTPVNGLVGLRISIYQGAVGGSPVYVETHVTTANVNGLASVEIGGGTVVTGTMAGINWEAGPYFVKTEADPTGGATYSIVGSSQLLSVPYALSAGGGSWTKNGADISNSNAGNVGIGTNAPLEKLDVAGIGSFGVGVNKMKVTNDGNGILSNRAGQFRMYTMANTGFAWYINLIEKMRMSSTGDLGIGNINPTAKLDVAGTVKFADGSQGVGKVLTSDATGLAAWTGFVGFTAIGGSNSLSAYGSGDRIFSTELFDDGNGYNPATGVYTVPETGTYEVSFSDGFFGNPGNTEHFHFSIVVNAVQLYFGNTTPGVSWWSIQLSRTIKLNAGDQIAVNYFNGSAQTVTSGETAETGSFTVKKIK